MKFFAKKQKAAFWARGLFAAALAFAFCACDFGFDQDSFQNKAGAYFLEMTSTAAVGDYEINPNDSVLNKTGVACIPCSGEHVVSLYLRNPQKYAFGEGNMSLSLAGMTEYPSSLVSIAQDPNDASKIDITYSQQFLAQYPLGTDISPRVELFHPVSQKSFGVFDKVNIFSDSPPPSVQLACFQRDGATEDDHYVVCFYLPKITKFANSYNTEGKTDVHAFYINGTKKYLNISDNNIYNSATVDDEGNWTFTDQDTSISGSKPSGLQALGPSGFEFLGNGTGDEAEYADSYVARYMTLPGTIAGYGTDTVTYNLTLEDDAGLSASLATSNKATRLSAPLLQDASGEPISASSVVSADEETGFYTLRIVHNGMDEGDGTNPPKPCGQVNINYTITKTAGTAAFGDDTGVLRGSSAGSATIKLPGRCTFTVQATASKNYYITSLKAEAAGVKVTQPAVFYVSQTGNNSENTGAKASPYRTIQYALNKFNDGIIYNEYEADGVCKIYVMTDLTPPDDFDFSSNNNSFVNIGGSGFTATVNITGYGGSRTIDAGQDQSDLTTRQKRVVYVAGGSVNIENINLANGYFQPESYSTVGYGGGLCVYGSGTSVTVKNSSIHSNYSSSGGGVYVSSNSTLYMENVSVYNNARYKYANGGGVYIGGTVTCVDCDIYENGWLNIPTGTVSGSDGGGGVLNGGTFSMTGGYIRNNMTYPTNGGGLSNKGSATLTGVTISGNRAPCSTSSVRADGGGICNTYTNAELTLKNCSVKENFAGGNGGGIFIDVRTSVSLEGTEISGNSAVDGGAGVYNYKSGSNIGSLKLKGKNTIYANTLADGTTASNLYMPTGSVITVEGDISGSKIGVNVPWQPGDTGAPSVGNPAVFTSDYGTYNTALPGEIFIAENNYGITLSDGGEAAFAVSGGGMYTALDYDVSMTSSSVKAALNTAKTVTVAVSGTRKEAIGTTTGLYYNNADGKFYTDSGLTTKAAGDNTVTFAAALYNGGIKIADCEIGHPELDSGSILVTVPALAFEDTYTLRVTSTFLGVTKDVNVVCKILDIANYSVDVDEVKSAIASGGRVEVIGRLTQEDFTEIASSVNSASGDVYLDLSMTVGLTTLADNVFNKSTKLRELILPEGLTTIDSSSLWCLYCLEKLHIPASCTTIEGNAFFLCSINTGLDITLDEGNETFDLIDGAIYTKDHKKLVRFANGSSTSSFTIPAFVEEIAEYAFTGAKFYSISFEEGSNLKKIGQFAFDYCNYLSSVSNLPVTVENIETAAWRYCTRLYYVYYEGSLADWENIEKGVIGGLIGHTVTVRCEDGNSSF